MRKPIIVILTFLALLLSACGSAPTIAPTTGAPAVPVTGNGAKVTISNFAFDPATITIKAGQTVTWTNQDTVAHTVVADDNSWKSPDINNGASFSHTFTTAGTYAYHCSIHPKMKATVIVTP